MTAVAADIETYPHTPLKDPAKQIRLLSLSFERAEDCTVNDTDTDTNTDIDINTRITCTLSTWNLQDAPKYTAISYAWGDASNAQTITVNGRTLVVRQNCHYALRQVALHWSSDHIWIDSICINQPDVHEKGLQVAMMAQIYTCAHRVCACVGPHDAASLSLLTFLASYTEFQANPPVLDRMSVVTSLPQADAMLAIEHMRLNRTDPALTWLWSHGRNWMRHLRTVVERFSNRDYWTRLWILQELRAAIVDPGNADLPILCGSDIIPWQRASYLTRLFLDPDARSGDDNPSWGLRFNRIWEVELFLRDFNYFNNMDKFSLDFCGIHHFACSDVRDRVYGTLTLLDWNMGGPAIFPNYTISYIDLAWDLVSRLRNATFGNVEFIVRGALEVDMRDVAVRKWFEMKRKNESFVSQLETKSWKDDLAAIPAGIYLSSSGELCADLRGWKSTLRRPSVDNDSPHLRSTIEVLSATELLEGDLLIQTDHFSLALRPCSSHGCEVEKQQGEAEERESSPLHFHVLGHLSPLFSPFQEFQDIDIEHINCECFGSEPVPIYKVELSVPGTCLDVMEVAAERNRDIDAMGNLTDGSDIRDRMLRVGDVVREAEMVEKGEGDGDLRLELKERGLSLFEHFLGPCGGLQGGRVEMGVLVGSFRGGGGGLS